MPQMPARTTAMTAAAGEFYVAYELSARGYIVAIPRANVPSLDLLVSDMSGRRSVSIQVKTSSGARRTFKRQPENERWEFDVGEKARFSCGENLFYAFVDLRWREAAPEVFIVPSKAVVEAFNDGIDHKRYMMWITSREIGKFRERWDIIEAALSDPCQESEDKSQAMHVPSNEP
jgi:hypothetical protein